MSTRHPIPTVSDGYRKRTQNGFGGYDHRLGSKDGTIFDMKNMCGDFYPLASTRRERVVSQELGPQYRPREVVAVDDVYTHIGVYLYKGATDNVTEQLGIIGTGKQSIAVMGSRIIAMPSKRFYDTATGEIGSLEAEWTGAAEFANGTYKGEEADGCRINAKDGTAFPFNAGDAVTITGAADEKNNTTIIIREISEDKTSLGFYENSFTVAESQTLTISRTVPDMDFICENENRLWGCKGDNIYASKLGDPFNFNVFDGIASDSFSVDTGSAGDFTACVSYGGYVIFFKEDKIFKVYGDKPSNFQAMASASLGVMKGSDRSLAVAGEALYYLSRTGIMVYTGGIPTNISLPFGNVRYCDAVGGSDGVRYYVSMKDMDSGEWSLFCYDTRYREWWREDNVEALDFCYFDGLRMLTEKALYRIGSYSNAEDGETAEGDFDSMVEFFDITESSPDKKYVSKVQLRLMLSEGAAVKVSMSFDDEPYREVKTLGADGNHSYYLPCVLHRCDYYRIRIEGTGKWKLCSLTREYSPGSEA